MANGEATEAIVLTINLRVVGIYYNKKVTFTATDIDGLSNPKLGPNVKEVLDQAVKQGEGNFFYIATQYGSNRFLSLDVVGFNLDAPRDLPNICTNDATKSSNHTPNERDTGWYIIADALGENPEKAWQYYILTEKCEEKSTNGKFVSIENSNNPDEGGIPLENNWKVVIRCLCIATKPSNTNLNSGSRFIQKLNEILEFPSNFGDKVVGNSAGIKIR
jgi:hypothetical protein